MSERRNTAKGRGREQRVRLGTRQITSFALCPSAPAPAHLRLRHGCCAVMVVVLVLPALKRLLTGCAAGLSRGQIVRSACMLCSGAAQMTGTIFLTSTNGRGSAHAQLSCSGHPGAWPRACAARRPAWRHASRRQGSSICAALHIRCAQLHHHAGHRPGTNVHQTTLLYATKHTQQVNSYCGSGGGAAGNCAHCPHGRGPSGSQGWHALGSG